MNIGNKRIQNTLDSNQVFNNETSSPSQIPKRVEYPQNFNFQNFRNIEEENLNMNNLNMNLNLEQKKMVFLNQNPQKFQNFNQKGNNPYGNPEFQNNPKKKFNNMNYQNNCIF